ncbi:MAG: hypothetical protein JKY48_17600 [Flavobacteriales bacterium]|nr:hypothetical protein [Flavobacteriales bacterium]
MYSSIGGATFLPRGDLLFGSALAKNISVSSFNGNGVIVGDEGRVWSTTDGGTNWTDETNSFMPLALNSVIFDGSTSGHCYAVGNGGTLLKSTDLGIQWQQIDAGTKRKLNDIAIDGGAGMIAGDQILVNINVNSMSIVTRATPEEYTQIEITVNLETLISLVSLLHKDGVHRGTGFNDLHAFDLPSSDGVHANFIMQDGTNYTLVANDGKIYDKPITGGTWVLGNEYEPFYLVTVQHLDANTLIASGRKYTLLISEDGGRSWKDHPDIQSLKNSILHTNGVINGAYFTDKGHGIIIVADGRAFTYTSGVWTPLQVNIGTTVIDLNFINVPNGFIKLDMLNETTGILLTNNEVYFSNTGIYGTWMLVENSQSISKPTFECFMVDEKTAYVGGHLGITTILKMNESTGNLTATTDISGPLRALQASQIRALYFYDQKRGYAAGAGSKLSLTTSGTESSWITKPRIGNTTSIIHSLESVTNGKLFYGGDNGAFGVITDFSEYFSDRFYYDKLGRLVASQNAKQYDDGVGVYSYTLYDPLGRIKEVGELNATEEITNNYSQGQLDNILFEAWVAGAQKSEITKTYYDQQMACVPTIEQEHLRSRVASSTYQEIDDVDDCKYDHATHYSYDVHGNVKSLYQEFTDLAYLDQNLKRIDYEYDLISGNVLEVKYQQNAADQFYHRYRYDSDNRITRVLTSPNGYQWSEDATYEYYRHGPVKVKPSLFYQTLP